MSAWISLGPLFLFLAAQAILNWQFLTLSRERHPDLWRALGEPNLGKTLLLRPKMPEKYVTGGRLKELPQGRDRAFARRFDIPFRVVNIGEWAAIALVVIDLVFF